jgi:hypothetical protein
VHTMRESRAKSCGQYIFIAFALIWTSLATFMAYAAWQSGGLVSALIPIVMVAIGIALLVGALWRYLAAVKVARPEISVSKSVLHVGESFGFVYHQMFKRPTDVQNICVQLIFRESATYTRGTDTTTDVHDQIIDSVDGSARHFEAGEIFHQDYSFEIPTGAMHTFIARHNKLQWFVRAQVDIAGWPDMNEEYEIQVLPERKW